jgi:hypothetical protein
VKAADPVVGINNNGPVLVIAPPGNIGYQNGQQTIIHGDMSINHQNGEITVLPGYHQPNYDGKTQIYKSETKPIFNYKTAKQYIDEANIAYKKHDYQKIIYLFEEALDKINQGKIKATPDEVSKIKHYKGAGIELVEKTANN